MGVYGEISSFFVGSNWNFVSGYIKKRWHTSWTFQLEITSNKKVISKKPLTNLYEMNNTWCYRGLLTGKYKRGVSSLDATGSRLGHGQSKNLVHESFPTWTKYMEDQGYWKLMDNLGEIGDNYGTHCCCLLTVSLSSVHFQKCWMSIDSQVIRIFWRNISSV